MKKLGYPAEEAASSPTTSLPKVQSCLTRRKSTLDGCCDDVRSIVLKLKSKNKSADSIQKTLRCASHSFFFFLNKCWPWLGGACWKYLRMVNKLEEASSAMDTCSDELGDLHTLGVIEGWDETLCVILILYTAVPVAVDLNKEGLSIFS